MVFTIKPAHIPTWGYEITARGFHNIAPSVDAAINYLQSRYGWDVKYRIINKQSPPDDGLRQGPKRS